MNEFSTNDVTQIGQMVWSTIQKNAIDERTNSKIALDKINQRCRSKERCVCMQSKSNLLTAKMSFLMGFSLSLHTHKHTHTSMHTQTHIKKEKERERERERDREREWKKRLQ